MSGTMLASGTKGTSMQVSEEKYAVDLSLDEHGLVVQFRGTISTMNPASVLNPFVDAVHDDVVKSGAPDVRIDLRELEFCNSSGFKAFIHWIERINQLPEEARYRLRFLSSPARRWQRTSLLALSCYGVTTVSIES
jgi:hypothetical protein